MDWGRVRMLFDEASALPVGERMAFVRAQSLETDEVKSEVVRLLEAVERVGGVLDTPMVRTLSHGDCLNGRYQVTQLTRRDAGLEVFTANDRRLGNRACVVTVVLDSIAPHLEVKRQIEAWASVEHDAVSMVLDYGETTTGRVFLITPKLQGKTLKTLMAESDWRMPPSLVTLILADVAGGLAAAHKEGLVHGNLQPENIRIRSLGRRSCGLVDYASRIFPTSGEDASSAGEMADVARLASIAFQVLTTKKPLVSLSHSEALNQLVAHGVSAPLAGCLARAISGGFDMRFANSSEFATALEGSLAPLADMGVQPPPHPPEVQSATEGKEQGDYTRLFEPLRAHKTPDPVPLSSQRLVKTAPVRSAEGDFTLVFDIPKHGNPFPEQDATRVLSTATPDGLLAEHRAVLPGGAVDGRNMRLDETFRPGLDAASRADFSDLNNQDVATPANSPLQDDRTLFDQTKWTDVRPSPVTPQRQLYEAASPSPDDYTVVKSSKGSGTAVPMLSKSAPLPETKSNKDTIIMAGLVVIIILLLVIVLVILFGQS